METIWKAGASYRTLGVAVPLVFNPKRTSRLSLWGLSQLNIKRCGRLVGCSLEASVLLLSRKLHPVWSQGRQR